MENYNSSKNKIYKIYNKQQEIDNIKDTKNYNLDQTEKSNIISNLDFYESDWILCTKTIIHPSPDNCFEFSFTCSYNLNIPENQLQNIEYALSFEGNIISYKQLENEEYLIGNYNPNLTFVKLTDNCYRLSAIGTGIAEGTEDVYVKLLISTKNKQYKTTNKYE